MENNGEYLFLDLGSGIANFSLYSEVEVAKRIHIVLSHYHLDHLIGIIYLLNICRDKEIFIYGPGKTIYGESCEDILCGIIKPPYFGRMLKDFSHNVIIQDYNIGFKEISTNYTIEFVAQKHSQPSFGMLINDVLYYATDTMVLQNTFEKAKDVKLLLHECWDIEENLSGKHSSLEKIIKFNEQYHIPYIKLIHINPNWTCEDFEKARGLLINHNIDLANDGDVFYL